MPKLQKTPNTPNATLFLRRPALSDSVPFFLLFLASRCSLLGISPFCVSMFFSVFDLKAGYLGIIAAALGIVSRGAAEDLTKYIPALMLLWLYSRLNLSYKESSIRSATVCGAVLFATGIISLSYAGISTYSVIMLMTECIVCSFSYIMFEKAGSVAVYSKTPPGDQELISAAVCTGIFISGLSGITIGGIIEISKVISAFAVMSLALHMPLAIAGSGGVAAGLICSMNDVSAVTYMGLYGISAMFAGMLKQFGKYGVSLGFLGGCAVILLYIGNTISVSLFEIITACALFAIAPVRLHEAIGSFMIRAVRSNKEDLEMRMRDYLLSRLSASSHAFARLASTYKSATDKHLKMYSRDLCTIIDTAAERVCKNCKNRASCMDGGGADMYRMMFSALEVLETKGFCNTSNVSKEFLSVCVRPEIFLCELSHAYELYKRDLKRLGEYENNRDLALRQYEEISNIFARLYDEIGNGFRFATELEEKISEELTKNGVSLRDVRAIENGFSELEILITLNKAEDKNELSEMLSKITGSKLEYRDRVSGSVMRFCQAAVYSVDYGEKQLTKGEQIVSGDSLTSFRTSDGKFYVILCDGMGSGSAAGRESRITGKLLEEFIKNGFSPAASVSIVNSSLALGIENESFSSVDLLCIDLMTGGAEFYKIGGCKSFIKHEEGMETVFSPSLPLGIMPDVHVSAINKRLVPGDTVIMMSDGAEGAGFGSLSGEKMKRLLSEDDRDPTEIAESVIESSGLKSITKTRDDITVAVIRLKNA